MCACAETEIQFNIILPQVLLETKIFSVCLFYQIVTSMKSRLLVSYSLGRQSFVFVFVFFCMCVGSGLNHGTQAIPRTGLRESLFEVLGIKLGLTTYKASTSVPVKSLWGLVGDLGGGLGHT